jgi:hypothetical protein
MDAYCPVLELNGQQALAYANKKYRSRRVIPKSAWTDLDDANIH